MEYKHRKIHTGEYVIALRVCRLKSGKWAIETKRLLPRDTNWEVNVNLPYFASKSHAEEWLAKYYGMEQEGEE